MKEGINDTKETKRRWINRWENAKWKGRHWCCK